MGPLLARVAALAFRRPHPIVATWLVLLAAAAWLWPHQEDHLSSGGWEVSESQSARAAELLGRFDSTVSTLAVLVSGRSPEEVSARLDGVRAALVDVPQADAGAAIGLAGGTAALLPVVDRGPPAAAVDLATELRERLVQTTAATQTRVVGAPAVWSEYQDVSKRQLTRAELVAFPVVLVILAAAFGTLVAALAPLALGIAVVLLGGAVIYGLSLLAQMSLFVTSVASMIGIGVAVDYSLFVVSRFRAERRARGTEAALRAALATSGSAVVFSGITVVLSLGALLLVELNAIRSVAIGAIVVVVLAVLAAVTLLPALLALAGDRIERLPVGRRRGERDDGAGADRFWRAWVDRTSARPLVSLLVAGGLLAVLAAPLASIETANRYLEQLPRDSEVRAATEQLQRLVGPGFLAPAHVIVSDPAAADEIGRRVAALPGVAQVRPPLASRDASLFLVDVVLGFDAELPPAREALARVEQTAAAVAAQHGAEVVVGGATRLGVEVQDAVGGSLPKMIAFILGVSYVTLLVLLRSVILPLKAVLMNLLSVGAAYGVLVAVFQWGWLDWTGHASPGHIDTIVLVLVLAVTFGISMDYEVFLLTRIRELYLAGRSNTEAVRIGLTTSARTITSAASIMIAVFGAFALAGSSSIKQLGIGLAVAILVDATIVRLVVVPAAMQLLGDRNWWLPSGLARVLPAPAADRRLEPEA